MVLHLVAARAFEDVGDLLQPHIASAWCQKRQVRHPIDRRAAAWVENDDNRKDAVTVIDLSDGIALIGGADGVKRAHRVNSPALEISVPEPNRQLRHAR